MKALLKCFHRHPRNALAFSGISGRRSNIAVVPLDPQDLLRKLEDDEISQKTINNIQSILR